MSHTVHLQEIFEHEVVLPFDSEEISEWWIEGNRLEVRYDDGKQSSHQIGRGEPLPPDFCTLLDENGEEVR